MADDLDDFFDDIEETVKEAKAQEEETPPDATTDNDDKQEEEKEKDGATEEPPAKRPKPNTSRVAVASAAPVRSVVAHNPLMPTAPDEQPPTALPGPPTAEASLPAFNITSHNNNNNNNNNNNQPPLPPGPAPPPPPPPTAAATSKKPVKRMAAGKVWIDSTLDEWPEGDFRLFVGNLPRDVTDQQLYDHFLKYASLARAKVVTDQKGVSKGYGFCSFLAPLDCAKAIREMDQTWLSARPIRVKRSDWKDRNLNAVVKSNKKQSKQRKRFGM
jgi:hypothetical protein